jgi:tetratricopeptide (TPR) repeat protein
MPVSNLTRCYEGVQRIYRNAVVRHVRLVFVKSYPDDHLERLRRPFQKEWADIKASAEERRNTGELSAQIVDEYDLLGVNHFFNLFDAHYDVIFPAESGADATGLKARKQAVLAWTKQIKNLRDPLSHPSEADFSYEDSFLILDCARRVLVQLNLHKEAEEIRQLAAELDGRPLSADFAHEPLDDSLPPRESIVVDFVGRQAELDVLWRWFDDPLRKKYLLAGDGGKGKSALAYQFAVAVKYRAPEPYVIVLWLTAKRLRFAEGKAVPIDRPEFVNLEGALDILLQRFGFIEDLAHSVERKRARVLELANGFPALIVVDDVDSLQGAGEDAIEFFLDQLSTTKSKILFTSRRVLFGMANITLQVPGLGEKEAEEFIASRCTLMKLSQNRISRHVREIIKTTEGSPLYMEDLLRLCSVLSPEEAIRAWKEKAGEEARRYALQREIELLTSNAREALLAACIIPGPASFVEIREMTGYSADQLAAALGELQGLFLLPKPVLIEGEGRYQVNTNTRLLVDELFRSTDNWRRLENARRSLRGDLPTAGNKQVQGLIRQAVLMVRQREQQEAEVLLKNALEKYPSDPNLLAFLGWVYKASEPPRITDARATFRRASELRCKNVEMYKHWARLEIEQREWTKAAEAAEQGLRWDANNRELLYAAGYARSRLARELAGSLHPERARQECETAQGLLERAVKSPEKLEVGERRLSSDIYRALVLNCDALDDAGGVYKYLDSWLAEHPDDGNAWSEYGRLSEKHKFPARKRPF